MHDREQHLFYLFVADRQATAQAVADSLTTVLESLLPGDYRLEIVDVLDQPEKAEKQGVFATPMLVRARPAPALRVLGDVTDASRVLALLGVDNGKETG